MTRILIEYNPWTKTDAMQFEKSTYLRQRKEEIPIGCILYVAFYRVRGAVFCSLFLTPKDVSGAGGQSWDWTSIRHSLNQNRKFGEMKDLM